MKKIIIAVITVVVILGVVSCAIMKKRSAASKATGPSVRLEKPRRGDLTEFVSAPGEIEPLTKVAISARVAARIVELPFIEGQRVTAGDPKAVPPIPPSVLVRLDSTDLAAALRSAEARRAAQASQTEAEKARIASQRAELEATRATLHKVEVDLERSQKLRETKMLSQSELDAAQTQRDELRARCDAAEHSLAAAENGLAVQQHNLEAAEADVARARDAISYTTITSPIDGVVTRLNAKVGELVMTGTMNNPGTVIMEVADLSKMVLALRVDEMDIANVRQGEKAVISIHAYPDDKFEGVVDTIALTSDNGPGGTKYYKTRVLVQNSTRPIYSGLTADAEIQTKTYSGVLILPSQAIIGQKTEELPLKVRENNPLVEMQKATTPVVYCFEDGKAVVKPVTIGASDDTSTVIQDGVSEEDAVIVGPYKVLTTLKDDMAVQDEKEIEKKEAAAGKKSDAGMKSEEPKAQPQQKGKSGF